MSQWSRWLRNAVGSTAWIALATMACAAPAAPRDFASTRPSTEASQLLDWVMHSRDAHDQPFAVVDKRAARIYVFNADGTLAGHSTALLGSATGDRIAPGVGAHAQSGHVPAEERTTPAGRFEASPGRNTKGEHVVWVDYESAFAIHRLRPGFSYQARSSRLSTTAASGKRLSWGCVVVPVAFYEQVVEKVLGNTRSVVYVMPEESSVQATFRAL
jgi:hypothetical protein